MLNIILLISILTFALVLILTATEIFLLFYIVKVVKSLIEIKLEEFSKKNFNVPVGVSNIEDGKLTEYTPHSSKVDKRQQAISHRFGNNVEESFNQERFAHLVSKKSETAVPFGEENTD